MPAPAATARSNLRQEGYAPLRPIEGRPQDGRARRFVARLSDDETPTADAIEAADFMQAALVFAETCAACDAGHLKIAVSDAETGETHCFTLNLSD
jgi:Family of unknown function (DUF5961)